MRELEAAASQLAERNPKTPSNLEHNMSDPLTPEGWVRFDSPHGGCVMLPRGTAVRALHDYCGDLTVYTDAGRFMVKATPAGVLAALAPEAKPEAEPWPAWVAHDDGRLKLYLCASDADAGMPSCEVAAVSTDAGSSPRLLWTAYGHPSSTDPFASGPETGTAGMDAAEAALRAADVLAPGVVVRRPPGVS